MFRGRRVDNSEWVYGYLIRGENTYIVSPGQFYNAVVRPPDSEGNCCMSTDVYWVRTDSVSQRTGFKDKNKKDVYEGDKVRFRKRNYFNEHDYQEGIIVYSPKYGAFTIDGHILKSQVQNLEIM